MTPITTPNKAMQTMSLKVDAAMTIVCTPLFVPYPSSCSSNRHGIITAGETAAKSNLKHMPETFQHHIVTLIEQNVHYPRRRPHNHGKLRAKNDPIVRATTSTETGITVRFKIIHFSFERTSGSKPKPAGRRIFTRAICLKLIKYQKNVIKYYNRIYLQRKKGKGT